jgi:hypothetical protein
VERQQTIDGPQLDRQPRPERPAERRPQPPQRIPETRPPLLGDWFIYLSIVVLVCGVIVITALEFGQPLTSPIVRLPFLLAGVLLIVLALDAMVRVWRSAWAWLPVDRGRGLFRFVWVAVLGLILLATVGGLIVVIGA